MAGISTFGLLAEGHMLWAIIGTVITFGLVFVVMFPVRMTDDEPPILRPKVPYIGHLLGMLMLSHNYHRLLFGRYKMSICTLPILGGKLYVINDPDLAQSAIKSRTLSFEPHVTDFIRKMTDVGEATMKIYETPAFFSQWIKIVYSSLTGEHLLAVNTKALEVVAQALTDIPTEGIEVPDLFVWARDLMTLASTTSLLGQKNPWRSDPELFNAYWDYERELVKMMFIPLPKITAPEGFRGRALMQKAMHDYFSSEYDTRDDVPKFTRDRMVLERDFGMTPSAMAGLEIAVLHGALSNTIPTAFWMLVYVFSNLELTQQLRDEANAIVKETGKSHQGQREITMDIVQIEKKCPLLYSTFCETQRIISIAVLNRRVMSDTVITDGKRSYVLKEGNMLQISHGVTHTLEQVWGSTANEFDGARFMPGTNGISTTRPEDKAVAPGAYTPFGAGKHICPGRHFASGEILGFIVPLLLGFEIVDSKDVMISVPDSAVPWLTTPMGKPVEGSDLRAKIRRRVGWEDVTWKVTR